MQDMFVWIIVFAGATIGLLATFLISSERELKRKRREVEEFAANLKSGDTAPALETTTPATAEETERMTQLIARNKELEDEVNSLSSRLRQRETASEELAAAHNQLSAGQLENVELRKSNQQLQEEIALLKNQLEVNLNQLSQSGGQHEQMAAHAARYEAENTGLRSKLEQSRQKIQDLESRQAQWAGVESREALMKEKQQRLESEIAQLNQQITVAREAAHESAAAQAQLRESETSRKQLLDDNQRLQQEISRWQERLADSEKQRRRLSAFRHNLEELKTKQAAVIETHRQLQEELDALARFVESSESAADAGFYPAEIASASDRQDSFRNEPNGRGGTTELPQTDGNSGASLSEVTNASEVKRRRRFGIFSAIVAVAVGGGVAAGFLR
jgi:chromosome segregation ATPase